MPIDLRAERNLITALYSGAMTPEHAAYLDIALEYGETVVVVGDPRRRKVIAGAAIELAKQYVDVVSSNKMDGTRAALRGMKNKPAYLHTDFDAADEGAAYAFFMAAATGHRVLGEVSGSDFEGAMKTLEEKGKVPKGLLPSVNALCFVGEEDGKDKVVAITEVVGIDPETNALKTHNAILSGYLESSVMDKISQTSGMSPDNLMLDFNKRKDRFKINP